MGAPLNALPDLVSTGKTLTPFPGSQAGWERGGFAEPTTQGGRGAAACRYFSLPLPACLGFHSGLCSPQLGDRLPSCHRPIAADLSRRRR